MNLILCTHCNNKYPFTSEYFNIYPSQRIPVKKMLCKKCRYEAHKKRLKYRYRNEDAYREKQLMKMKKYQKNNPTYFKDYMNNLNTQIRNKLGVGYDGLHKYIRNHLTKPNKCPFCNEEKRLELHCKNHDYTRDIKNWMYTCRKCHALLNKNIVNI